MIQAGDLPRALRRRPKCNIAMQQGTVPVQNAVLVIKL